jgi:hypothetical protein
MVFSRAFRIDAVKRAIIYVLKKDIDFERN